MAHADGRQFRLSWGETRKAANAELRELPTGRYTWRGYRLMAEGEEDLPWFLSVTGKGLGSFEVVRGRTQELEVDPKLYLTTRASLSQGKVRVQMAFKGSARAGATVYRDGERIPVEASLVDSRGRTVASEQIEYG